MLSERSKWYYNPEWRAFMAEVFEAGVKMDSVTQNQIFRQAAIEPVTAELKALNTRSAAMHETLVLILAELKKPEPAVHACGYARNGVRPERAQFAEWGRQGAIKRWQNARALAAGKVQ
jgi:hypothetical protein